MALPPRYATSVLWTLSHCYHFFVSCSHLILSSLFHLKVLVIMTTDFFVARIFSLLLASIVSEMGTYSLRLCNLSFCFFLLSHWLLYFTFFYEQNSLFSVHPFNVRTPWGSTCSPVSPNYILPLGNITYSPKLWTKHIRIQMTALTLSLYGLEKHTKLL